MTTKTHKGKLATAAAMAAAIGVGGAGLGSDPASAAEPKRGGTLEFVVGSKIPSYDGHKEATFGMIHPIRPFYSLLIRVNPDNPQSTTDWQCDLCEGSVPEPTNGGKTYTFKIRQGVKFHDGTPLSSADLKATFDRLIFPPEGVVSRRQAYFRMVESVAAPDAETLIFNLKHPSGAFIPAVGMPFNFVYSKKDLSRKDPKGKDALYGMNWPLKNINGTGAFKFVQHQPGAFVEGKRYDGYHLAGKPYLDGFKSISAPKMAVRLQAIRGDRAAIEFRGFPPKARDDLVNALGGDVRVQESDWNCQLLVGMNHKKKPFDDPRVRKALMHAIDRWGASKNLSKIAIVKTVGGIVFPSDPLAISDQDLKEYVGYWPDIEKARAEARRLLKEAGAEGLTFDLHNRAVDQPYRILGTWLIGEWKKIGVKVTQRAVPTSPWLEGLRKATAQVSLDANCQSVVNPLLDVSKYISVTGNPANYSHYDDPELDKMFDQMIRSGDQTEQIRLMRAFEKRVLHDEAHYGMTLWWYKINPHRSYVEGWNIAPSHYLNQHLDQVWLNR